MKVAAANCFASHNLGLLYVGHLPHIDAPICSGAQAQAATNSWRAETKNIHVQTTCGKTFFFNTVDDAENHTTLDRSTSFTNSLQVAKKTAHLQNAS